MMAKKFAVTHSDDAMTIHVRGDIRNPEPSSAIIKFPGGHVEVTRCSDGSYWCHFQRCISPNSESGEVLGEIIDSRIDYTPEAWAKTLSIPPIPAHEDIQHIAVRVEKSEGF